MCPFEFGFLDISKGGLAVTDNIVNAFFAFDIILTFFVAYLDKPSYMLIDDRKSIALRYAKSGLILDVLSTIPYEVVKALLPKHGKKFGYVFNILRLWRLRRASDMFSR